MADEEKVTTEEQALADEWAAALAEAGDASQDDIDALMAQGGATPVAEPSTPRAPMEEFGASPKAPTISGLEGPNLDVILDIPVTISMEVGHTDISIRNLLQLNQGSVIELDRLAGEPLDVLVNGTLIAHGEVVVVIFLLAWLVRRVQQAGPRGNRLIRTLASQPLGPRDRLVLVQVGEEQILLGLTPGRITPLHVLKEPVHLPDGEPATPEFAQRLLELLNKDPKGKP